MMAGKGSSAATANRLGKKTNGWCINDQRGVFTVRGVCCSTIDHGKKKIRKGNFFACPVRVKINTDISPKNPPFQECDLAAPNGVASESKCDRERRPPVSCYLRFIFVFPQNRQVHRRTFFMYVYGYNSYGSIENDNNKSRLFA
jgi:hypothetical protein